MSYIQIRLKTGDECKKEADALVSKMLRGIICGTSGNSDNDHYQGFSVSGSNIGYGVSSVGASYIGGSPVCGSSKTIAPGSRHKS